MKISAFIIGFRTKKSLFISEILHLQAMMSTTKALKIKFFFLNLNHKSERMTLEKLI